MTIPIAMSRPPTIKRGVIFSPRKYAPRRVPTTGWAKKVSEARLAFTKAKAEFHRNMASAVDMIPINSTPASTAGGRPAYGPG